MGQAKQRQEKLERLYETTRGAARVLPPARQLAARAFLLAVIVNAPRRERYDIVDYDALQQAADAVAIHLRERFPDERFCLIAFPALYPLYGLYDEVERSLAFVKRAHDAALTNGIELNTHAWCMDRKVVTELERIEPQLQETDLDFAAAVLCYLPVVVIGEGPLSKALREASGNLTTGAGWALARLTSSQDLDVGYIGLFPADQAEQFYEMFACEALATRIAQASEAPPQMHFILDAVVLSKGNEVWLGTLSFAGMVEEEQNEEDATLWLLDYQRLCGLLRRKLIEHGLVVRAAFLYLEEDVEEEKLADETLKGLRSGELASGEDFVIESVEGESGEQMGRERYQLTEYFYDQEFVLGVLSATRGMDVVFQQNLYPCSDKSEEAILAYAEQTSRDAGCPLQRIRHDGAVLVCPHCSEPVPQISEDGEDAQPLTHSLH